MGTHGVACPALYSDPSIKQLGTSNKMLKFFREKNTKEEALEKLRQMEWVRNKQDSWHLSRFVNRKKLNPMRYMFSIL